MYDWIRYSGLSYHQTRKQYFGLGGLGGDVVGQEDGRLSEGWEKGEGSGVSGD